MRQRKIMDLKKTNDLVPLKKFKLKNMYSSYTF